MNNNQQDPRWANTGLGDGSTTIGFSGCTISVIGDVLGLTPDVVNQKLQSVGGFLGSLVIWQKLEVAFPGLKINRVWSYNNDDVLAHVPNVIIEVPADPIGGTGSHWVNYIGNHQLKDPWTGTIRPTSDFSNPTGYCTFDLTNYHPIQTPTVDPLQPELDQCRIERDKNWNLYQSSLAEINQVKQVIDNLNQQINDRNNSIATLQGQIATLTTNGEGKDMQIQTLQVQANKVPGLTKELAQSESDRLACLNAETLQQTKITNLENTIAKAKPTKFIDKLRFLLS